jgi:HK97 family phage major capsid protein
MADMTRRIRAAAPHTFVAEIPGLIPESIVGPVVNLRDASAPLFNALGPNTAPAGKSFTIPYIDPNLDAAVTGTEKSDVTDQLGVKEVTVTLDFVKRAVNISAEAVAFSQPSVIDVAVSELADAIALGCEKNVVTKLEAVTGTSTAVEVAADGADAWSVLAGAQAAAYAATGRTGNVFVCAPDVWAALAGMTNTLGAPLIGGINQSLVGDFGTLFGMRVVVSPQMTTGKAYILNTAGVKTWTNASVNMRVDEPTILGYALGAGRSVGLSVASPKFITPVTIAAAP